VYSDQSRVKVIPLLLTLHLAVSHFPTMTTLGLVGSIVPTKLISFLLLNLLAFSFSTDTGVGLCPLHMLSITYDYAGVGYAAGLFELPSITWIRRLLRRRSM
jgi:hypothetical protein